MWRVVLVECLKQKDWEEKRKNEKRKKKEFSSFISLEYLKTKTSMNKEKILRVIKVKFVKVQASSILQVISLLVLNSTRNCPKPGF